MGPEGQVVGMWTYRPGSQMSTEVGAGQWMISAENCVHSVCIMGQGPRYCLS